MFSTGDFLTQNQCTQSPNSDIYHLKKQHSSPRHSQPKGIDSTLAVECNMRQNVEVLCKAGTDAVSPTPGSKSAGCLRRSLEDTVVKKVYQPKSEQVWLSQSLRVGKDRFVLDHHSSKRHDYAKWSWNNRF